MLSLFRKKEKKPQKVIVHSELGELKFDAIEWYPAAKIRVALWNRVYDVPISFFAKSEEEEPAPSQEAAYQKFKNIVVEQRDTIEKMILEDAEEEDAEKAGNRLIPYAIYISREGECALAFGDTAECEECDFSHETGFALFLIPRLLIYSAEECLDFMLGYRDQWTLGDLYGQKNTDSLNAAQTPVDAL